MPCLRLGAQRPHSLSPNDKILSDALYDFTARLLCALLPSQLQVYESEQRASWAQALGRLCPTLKIQAHDECSILTCWEGAQGCRGAGILSVRAVPGCAHPSFSSLHPAVSSHHLITVGPVR